VNGRDLSVVVFGATGITGRQVARHLAARSAEEEIRWAAAGRDPAKVERVLAEIGVEAPETIRADVDDVASLSAMAGRTRVVLDLVGPYSRYGEPVIEACIEAGTHYADLTGEIPFVRRMIDSHQERAANAGVKVVNASGFECLPADLAVLLAGETARERWDEGLATVDLDVTFPMPSGRIGLADMISGGTMQSVAGVLDDERAEIAADPAALITDPDAAEQVRRTSPIAVAPRLDGGEALGPMVPVAFINPAFIQRTAALAAAEDGRPFEPFRYREGVALGGGRATLPLRWVAAGLSSATQAAAMAVIRSRPQVRRRVATAVRRFLPASGFGPTGERLEEWTWQLRVDATTTGGHFVRIDLDADGQPGYLTTARILGEVGLLLAEEGATPSRSGFLTPAMALGTAPLDRLERAGIRFRVSS
jgi:short subunit dehydrogenase-like uncharacterized protein